MNSNTHNTLVNAWRYSVTRAERRDSNGLLPMPEKRLTTYKRIKGRTMYGSAHKDGGTLVQTNGLRHIYDTNRWQFTPR